MCTEALARYAEGLLAYGFTLKETAHVTGLCRNAVKDIDRKRLWLEDGPKDGQRRLRLPDRPPKRIGIDEFRLHDGHRYATIIADLETGHVLWVAHGRKKQAVHGFVERAGMEWMAGVEAVASDMNSDYQEAFLELCPHLDIVYDHFHIVKNFNEKAISEARKDIQRELVRKGDKEAARKPKHTKHLLMPSAGTRARWEREAGAAPEAGSAEPLRRAHGRQRAPACVRPREGEAERCLHALRHGGDGMRHPGHDTHLPGDRGQPLRMVRKAARIPLRRDSRPCEAPHLDRQGGRHQQPHQDIEAQGIRLSGRRLFLPQDSRCLIPEGQVLIWGRTQEKCKTQRIS